MDAPKRTAGTDPPTQVCPASLQTRQKARNGQAIRDYECVKPLQSSPGRLASHLHAERQAQPQAAGLLPWPRFPAVLCVRPRRTSPESVSRICTILEHQKYTLKNRPFSVACLGASINGQWEVRNFLLHLQWITSDLTTTQPKENDCRASGLIPPILRRHSAPPAAEAPHTNRRSGHPGHRGGTWSRISAL